MNKAILDALTTSRHVHCEKPFCRFLGEGERALEEIARRGLRIEVGETYLFLPNSKKPVSLSSRVRSASRCRYDRETAPGPNGQRIHPG